MLPSNGCIIAYTGPWQTPVGVFTSGSILAIYRSSEATCAWLLQSTCNLAWQNTLQ